MKCVILAAGYATRLYPLTENFPKPLLMVGDRAILDWLIDDLGKTGLIEEFIVVTNHKFAHIFEEWAAGRPKITVIDDGTSTNETRLGAVKDIELGINIRNVDDDLLVMAGDNLLDFSLGGFINYAREKGTTCIMRYHEPNEARLHKCGVVEIDADDKILSMEEKPSEPKSHWCCPPFYYYKKDDLKLVSKGIAEGCGTDAPGSFIAWLCGQTKVYAWEMPGRRYDIGNLESYEEVKKTFAALK
jgi:glucose-1-phosphate thymidylyltransferase